MGTTSFFRWDSPEGVGKLPTGILLSRVKPSFGKCQQALRMLDQLILERFHLIVARENIEH